MPCGDGRAADDVPLELAEDRRSRCKRWDPNANIIYGELHKQCISTDCLGDDEKGVHWPEVIHAGDIHCADLEDGFGSWNVKAAVRPPTTIAGWTSSCAKTASGVSSLPA